MKLANKDMKLKDEKVLELKKEVGDLTKLKIDKIESIKRLQSMLST